MVDRSPAHYSALIAAGIVWGTLSSGGCAGAVPPGSSCNQTSDCQSGLSCLFPIGSGCGGKGQCIIQTNDCSGEAAGLSICGCGASVDLSCIPSSFALAQPTQTGPACGGDAGPVPPDGSLDQ